MLQRIANGTDAGTTAQVIWATANPGVGCLVVYRNQGLTIDSGVTNEGLGNTSASTPGALSSSAGPAVALYVVGIGQPGLGAASITAPATIRSQLNATDVAMSVSEAVGSIPPSFPPAITVPYSPSTRYITNETVMHG